VLIRTARHWTRQLAQLSHCLEKRRQLGAFVSSYCYSRASGFFEFSYTLTYVWDFFSKNKPTWQRTDACEYTKIPVAFTVVCRVFSKESSHRTVPGNQRTELYSYKKKSRCGKK